MPKRYALNIGVKDYLSEVYKDKFRSLFSPEYDAQAMKEIAEAKEYDKITVLLTKQATKEAFSDTIKAYQSELGEGDYLLITFSGHGDQTPIKEGETSEPNESKNDESWCFYDGLFIDDELKDLWKGFKEGVKILVISECCFSGGMAEAEPYIKNNYQNKDKDILASIIFLASVKEDKCSDNGIPEKSHSNFTTELLKVWDNGNFCGTHEEFREEIYAEVAGQYPQIYFIGKINQRFINSPPFLTTE